VSEKLWPAIQMFTSETIRVLSVLICLFRLQKYIFCFEKNRQTLSSALRDGRMRKPS